LILKLDRDRASMIILTKMIVNEIRYHDGCWAF